MSRHTALLFVVLSSVACKKPPVDHLPIQRAISTVRMEAAARTTAMTGAPGSPIIAMGVVEVRDRVVAAQSELAHVTSPRHPRCLQATNEALNGLRRLLDPQATQITQRVARLGDSALGAENYALIQHAAMEWQRNSDQVLEGFCQYHRATEECVGEAARTSIDGDDPISPDRIGCAILHCP